MRKLFILLVILGLVLLIAAGVLVFWFYPAKLRPLSEYNAAAALFDKGNYVPAALQFEDMGGYSDSAARARSSWIAAGDKSFEEGDLAQARTYYLKGGATGETLEKLDSEYYKLGVLAYADDRRVDAENAFSCITEGSLYLDLLDQVRISCGERFVKNGDFESAGKVFRLCGSASDDEITSIWMESGSSRLDAGDLSSASYCFAKAMAYTPAPENTLSQIDSLWVAAAQRASAAGDEELAEKCYARTSSGSEARLAAIYENAVTAYEQGSRTEALRLFSQAGEYSDSEARAEALREELKNYFNAGGAGFFATLEAGSVGFEGDWGVYRAPAWANISSVAVGKNRFILGLTASGSVLFEGNDSEGCGLVYDWRGVIQVAAGRAHSAALTASGTVLACGSDPYGQVSGTAEWSDVAFIACGWDHTVAVTRSGGVLACGDDTLGQCSVGSVTGAVSAACGSGHTAILLNNGRVVSFGNNTLGQCSTAGWSGVVAVFAGANHTIGLREDGTLLACGENAHGECEVSGYTGVVSVACGEGSTLILLSDGTRVKLGN